MLFRFRWIASAKGFVGMSMILLLAGCGATAPVQYFQLSVTQVADQALSGDFQSVHLGIGPVTMPAYLDRPQIALRASANELSFADQYRWAEPLGDNFSRVLAEDLSRLLGTEQFQVFPWRDSRSVDMQIVVEVVQFENMADGKAVLEARWKVQDNDGKLLLPVILSRFENPAGGAGQADRVASLSITIGDLSREIVTRLTTLKVKL